MTDMDDKVKRDFRTLHGVLKNVGHDVRMVGGAVRDLIRGITPTDYDFATTATPELVMHLFNNEYAGYTAHGTGLKHGTVTVVVRGTPYEVTTLRLDMETDGRHADVVFTKDWELDAARRDFTMNAMYMDIDGHTYDYYNGKKDILNGIIRFVGDPNDRIQEDYLRILRYFRFFSMMPNPAPPTDLLREAIIKHAKGLEKISGERIWSEVTKILGGPSRGQAVLTMRSLGVVEPICLPVPTDGLVYLQNVNNGSWISGLSSLLRSKEELDRVHDRWKFDTNSYRILQYVIANRKEKLSIDWVNEQVVRGTEPNMIFHLATFQGNKLVADYVRALPLLPKFPVNGNDVKSLGYEGRDIGRVLNEMQEEWIASGFTMARDTLLERHRANV